MDLEENGEVYVEGMSRIILYLSLSERQGVLIKFRASLYD